MRAIFLSILLLITSFSYSQISVVQGSGGGDVGIGTTQPSHKLDVVGSQIISGPLDDSPRLMIHSENRYFGTPPHNHDLAIINGSGNWLRMGSRNDIAFFSNAQQSTLETASTGYKMFINDKGVAVGGGECWFPYSFVVYGDAYTYGNWIGSDERIKQDISEIDGALEKVKSLNGVSYRLDMGAQPEALEIQRLGYVAQELQKVIPEAVLSNDEGYLSVNYDFIIPLLSESIKEQQETIDSLASEIMEMKLQISQFDAQLNSNFENRKSRIFQNQPNPFNEITQIRYELDEGAQNARVAVYTLNGLQKLSFPLEISRSGMLEISGNQLEAGMYLYSLFVNGELVETKRMILTD